MRSNLAMRIDVGEPDAAVYKGHSADIIYTLEDQLATARKTETANLHNFQMLKQSLEDEIKFGNADMAEAKKGLAESAEKLAGARGDLGVTSKDLAADIA